MQSFQALPPDFSPRLRDKIWACKAWVRGYLIVAKAVPFAASAALSYLTTVHSAILIRSQLEYDRGREYTDSGHVFILAISHAHRYAYTIERCTYTLRADTQPAIIGYTLCQLLHRPSLQSCQVEVVNYAPRGMSLLETSSYVKCIHANHFFCC